MSIEPFALPYSKAAVEDLRARLQRTRWPDELPGSAWTYGTSPAFMREVCRYWRDKFEWQDQLERVSQFHHFKFTAPDFDVHFIHERGTGPNPIPLVLTHGWPGSFLEMLKIVPLLTDPGNHGGDPYDSFDVIVPSLPGYGYSSKPGPGVSTFTIAQLWTELMSELGYDRFAAQGGDLGAGVTTALGLRHASRMHGIHLNLIPGSYRPPRAAQIRPSPEEEAYLKRAAEWFEQHGAYSHMQRTTPITPAYALNDSPAGLAAWILEKFQKWADCQGDLLSVFTVDELLSNVTLYWMTESIHSSFRLYYEGLRAPFAFTDENFVHTPTAIAHFPREILFPPPSWVERGYNVQQWTEMPRGGHFAAWEEPALLAEDLRKFFRRFR
jgi:pimeloyl-ACP methyl ester carboxylesterase